MHGADLCAGVCLDATLYFRPVGDDDLAATQGAGFDTRSTAD